MRQLQPVSKHVKRTSLANRFDAIALLRPDEGFVSLNPKDFDEAFTKVVPPSSSKARKDRP
jgi:hypothetical protein